MATSQPAPQPSPDPPSRRQALTLAVASAAGACLVLKARPALASGGSADPPELREAMSRFAGTSAVREGQGRITLELPELVENGNAVPVTVSVDSPMTEREHVVAIALFTSRNPLPEVAEFRFGPRSGRARVATRIRLSTSQHVVAMARLSDGSVWARRVEVLVTLAACVES